MKPELVCRALAAIGPVTATFEQFQFSSGILSKSVAKSTLKFLDANGIGDVSETAIRFSSSDRLKAAILAVQTLRCDIEQVSRALSWKDFEGLAAEVLTSLGYTTRSNVRFVKPRMEIDVYGIRSGLGLAVDCKHWRRSNISSIVLHSKKQALRAARLAKEDKRVRAVVPAVLTLYVESVRFIEGIPLVPISQFRSFVMELKEYLPEIYALKPD